MMLRRSLGVALAAGMLLAGVAQARELTGKVVGVFHEPVMVTNKTFDKVSVAVKTCGTGNYELLSYSPGVVSSENSLGHLFEHLATSARSTEQKNQYMNSVSGHGTFVVNEQNVIQKTTFWGYNWECGKDLDAGATSSAPAAGQSAPAQKAAPASGGSPLGKIRKFGL